ncbi:M61 family metallopeptidase [Sphaerotilus natans]|uniref:Peptidase M61 domain-containing protein n=1 Tax=Sphaerotilus natans subsp. natans DSM 6575 TaxID=1286631 RepID=A0A059KHC4_9BURK|nr:PDZ domain-containing protein [Sphaerotilus natans]KDB50856.1 peptidase M61 domain-containing protein [Sphaerotilus natans subsp. natans DSM 6575]SIQ75082.1 Predicted metalloprotease, contains C-terminal PDZ domain [Sphaerotilus natans]
MIRLHLEIDDLRSHHYRVTMTLPHPAPRQRLSLPAWIPGSYLVREFARHLSDLKASQGRRAVTLTQLDKHSWEADCSGRGALTLSWRVYAFDNSVRCAWLDAQRGFFNGTGVFLRAEGREADEHRVTLGALPEGWQVATGLPEVAPGEWSAPDYDALIDHPFELGTFWRGRFTACGAEHEFVVAGALPGFDGERLLADTKKICEAQIRFWHGRDDGCDPPPFERYVFMLNATDDGYGGLEHRNSTALICTRRDLPRRGDASSADGYVTLLGLISHEYFHTWNVKRLKPREFAAYALQQENYTRLLWFFEGFTSYYDDLFLVRTGLIDEARYLRLVARTANQVLGTPGRRVQSAAAASFDAWVKYYRPDENSANATVSYYTKGAQIALCLDLTLRAAGRGSLDEVMRELWRASGGGPIGEDDILAALRRVGRRDFAPEIAAWVHGTEDLPLAELLPALGVDLRRERPLLQQRLGARLNEAAAGLKVQAVLSGGLAEAAGLSAGDEILALGDWRVVKPEDLTLYGAFEQALPLLVARDRRLLRLTLPAGREVEGAVALSLQGKPAAAVRRRREAWLTRAGA